MARPFRSEPIADINVVQAFNNARAHGMPPASAARYVAYLRHVGPLDVVKAADQVRAVRGGRHGR